MEFKPAKLDIISEIEVFKVGSSVFAFNNLNFNDRFFKNIIKILDLGFKFVPNFFYNYKDLFVYFLKSLEEEIVFLNKKVFLNFINSDYNQASIDSNNDVFESIFKKFRKKQSPLVTRKCLEMDDFKYSLLQELCKLKVDCFNNFSSSLLRDLKYFLKLKPFKIIQCDN